MIDLVIKQNRKEKTNLTIEERVKQLIIRDLIHLKWNVQFNKNSVLITPPESYDKQTIVNSMAVKRGEILAKNIKWINNHIDLARSSLTDGRCVSVKRIDPIVEVCETQKQHDIFRIFRYYWSSPYSDYVGRRVKLLIRDRSIESCPVIGIAALGSPIIHIPERDDWISWDKNVRTKNIVYTMDAYVIGALPPYNYLLGGKLISYILASNEVREIYKNKYKDVVTQIEKRKACDMACIFTTSLYGKSSQYNRIKYNNRLLYIPIGETKGFGTLHLTEETFSVMLEFLKSNNITVANCFGDGPSWRMRVIRSVGDLLGFDSDILLRHSFKRNIYAIPLADNFKEFLLGYDNELRYYDYPLKDMVDFWKQRWGGKREVDYFTEQKVQSFRAKDFEI